MSNQKLDKIDSSKGEPALLKPSSSDFDKGVPANSSMNFSGEQEQLGIVSGSESSGRHDGIQSFPEGVAGGEFSSSVVVETVKSDLTKQVGVGLIQSKEGQLISSNSEVDVNFGKNHFKSNGGCECKAGTCV
jgi:hypothetical protein